MPMQIANVLQQHGLSEVQLDEEAAGERVSFGRRQVRKYTSVQEHIGQDVTGREDTSNHELRL